MLKRDLIHELELLRFNIERTVTDYKANDEDIGWNNAMNFVLRELNYLLDQNDKTKTKQ